MPPRKLLLVSYEFPPFGGIPVQRALNFAKYLPGLGVEVHVLTALNAASPIRDESLLAQVPAAVQVHRAFTPEPPFHLRKRVWEMAFGRGAPASAPAPAEPPQEGWKARVKDAVRRPFLPDPQVLWKSFAVRAGERIIRRHGIDTVLVTVPPFSVLLTGIELKRRCPHVRLVSDFRDEWLRFMLTDFDFHSGDTVRRQAEAIERKTVECSDVIVAVTQASLNEIRSRYPEQPGRKWAMVPNGYDPQAFTGVPPPVSPTPGRMKVGHMGTAYRTASPRYYLDALDRLPAVIRSSIETRFIGRIAETETGIFQNRLSDVRLLGFQPQPEALRLAAECDYLLLTMTNDFSLPGKLFEYLALGRPVLALSPNGGEVDRLLRETGAGWCAPHDDPAAAEALLLEAWKRLDNTPPPFSPNLDAIRRYERPRLAAQLFRELEERLG